MSIYHVTDGWIGVMNALFGAKGALPECGVDAEFALKLVDKALDKAETAFCRADRSGYKEWAADISDENGQIWEPCDAWYEGDLPEEEYDWIHAVEA